LCWILVVPVDILILHVFIIDKFQINGFRKHVKIFQTI
jgi:hypothetical protein